MTYKSNRNIFLLGAVISWALFSALSFWKHELYGHVLLPVKGLTVNTFLVCLFLYYYIDFKKRFEERFDELLKTLSNKVLIDTGIFLPLFLAVETQSIDFYWLDNKQVESLFFFIIVGFGLDLLLALYAGWRLLLFYEVYDTIKWIFWVFEAALVLSLVAHLFDNLKTESQFFNVLQGAFLIIILAFCLTIRWIAQLNLSQKRIVLLYLVVVLLGLAFFYWLIEIEMQEFEGKFIQVSSSLTIRTMSFFVIFYGLASLLMTVFNLPTATLFERKILEIQLFNQTDDTLQAAQSEPQFLVSFLERAMKTTHAEVGWVKASNGQIWAEHNSSPALIQEVEQYLDQRGIVLNKEQILDRGGLLGLAYEKFNSIMLVPIKSYKGQIALAVLLKRQSQGFYFANLNTVSAYAQQIGLIIENSRTLKQVVENERLKDQILIAKQIQNNLLPQKIDSKGYFEIAAISVPAREMGGDYYDFVDLGQGRFALIVADVSGNGLSAAFGMAILKGIFRATIATCHSAASFLCTANSVLASCLDKKTFITATVLLIDAPKQQINLACAGHCTTIYSFEDNIQPAHEHQGIGLAIARDERFAKFIVDEKVAFQNGSLLLLYTDGIVESYDPANDEQFGVGRIYEFLQAHSQLPAEKLVHELMECSTRFGGADFVDDDSTVVCIRF